MDDVSARRRLRHVLWLGGPPDAGKTTVAGLIAARHGATVYHFDRHEMDHLRRADPVRQPALHAFGRALRELGEDGWRERDWVAGSPAAMARDTVASWTERVGLAVEDLLALPADRPIVAEGPGFFPAAILPLLDDPRRAAWLVPTEAFKRAAHARRGKTAWRDRVSDPDRALRHHVERDLLLADHYRRELRRLNLPSIEVDGTRPAASIATEVEEAMGLGHKDGSAE